MFRRRKKKSGSALENLFRTYINYAFEREDAQFVIPYMMFSRNDDTHAYVLHVQSAALRPLNPE